MDKSYEDSLQRNAQLAADKIVQPYLEGKTHGSERVRVAVASITQYNRYLATKGAFATLHLMISRSIAENKEELKKLIAGNPARKLT